MKKRWLAAIMAMILAVSPVAAQTVDASQSNVIMADMMESQRDSLVGDEIDTASLETGETATSPYVDTDADPTKSYEYTIVGDDGSVAVVEVPAVLEKYYSKYDFVEGTPVPNGTYVIIGANSGTSLNRPVVRTTDTVHNNADYTKLIFDSAVTVLDKTITADLSNGEWEVVYDSNDARYTFKVPGEDKYLAVYSGNNTNGTVTTSSSQDIQIVGHNNGDGKVAIGGAHLTGNSDGWLNYRGGDLGSYTSGNNDNGSSLYLYQLKCEVTDEAVAAATADVTGTADDYTEDSWNAYQTALTNCETIYGTDDEALAAYEALVAAVAGLQENAPAVSVEKVYVKYEPDFDAGQPILDDTYVIVGANTGVSNNKKASDWVIIRDGNSLKYQKIDSYLTDTPRVIETALDNSEWDFTYQTTTNGVATYIIGKDGTYLNVGSSATISTNSAALNVISNSHYPESVSIGTGATNATTYLNFSVNHDTVQLWSTDGGSAWYLYALKYVISDDEIAAATATVKSQADYTEDSWNAYQEKLTAADGFFGTQAEADAAYAALVDAVAALEEKAPEVPEEPDTPEVSLDLEPTFVKITPKTTDSGIVIEDGIYVIVGAYDYYYNGNSNKALNSDTSITYTDVASYVSGATLTQTDPAYEWKITAVSGGYTIEAVDGDGYLNITSDNSANGVTVGENEQVVTIVKNNRSATAVAIGAPMNNRVAYVNARRSDGAGTWYDNDGGSALDLYQKIYKIPMETLYAEICKANGGPFLYSEECYDREAGLGYRDALKAARQNFATLDAAEDALSDLIASVKNLQENTIAESCFPVMTWGATVDRNRTVDNPDTADVDETTLPNYVPRLAYLDTDGYDPDPDDPDNVTFEKFEALTWKWSEIARLVNDEDERISPVWGQADNGMFARRFSVRSSEETNDWQHANVYKIAGQFAWPEGYKLSETTIVLDSTNDFFYRDIYEYISENDLSDTFPLGQVLPINDDIYVVMWAETEENKEESRPTVDNINDYLAFWSGTSGKGFWTKNGNASTENDWGRDEPATYIEWNLQGERAFYESFPNKVGTGETKEDGTAYTNSDVVNLTSEVANYLDHTEQWYTLTDTSSINSVMRANYTDEEMKPGTIVHLDLYVMNNSGSGYLDELEIELFKEKATETTVTVNYYLNEVSENGFLGSESLLNQEYGTKITLLPGTRAGQLNSYKKEAIYQAGYRDVTDGVQVNELIVTEGGNNVVNVLYTEAAEKIVYLKAPSATHKYDGNDKTLNTVEVTVVENGVTQTAELVDSQYGTYKLPDGNFIRNVHSYVTEDLPGIYENNFTMENGVASSEPVVYEHDENGNIDLNTPLSNYRIVKVPGTLTITYEPAKFSGTYDFAGLNTYEDALNDVEKTAITKGYSSAEMYFTEDENTVSFRPSAVYNTAKEINVTLTFAGDYKVNKTYSFVPASNVLYGDNYMTVGETSVWTQVGEAVEWEITDNESTEDTAAVYGYSFDVFDEENSNATALKATLDINGETGIQGLTAKTDAMTFEFSGTGFDLISACGPDTGMLVVKLENKDTGKAKSYLVDTYFTGDDSIITSDGTSDVISYQVPVIREFGLDYANYKVTVYGYLINTAGAVTTYARGRAAVPTEDIVMTVLEELEMYDVEVEDVELSYIDENSVLNGGTGSVNASSGFGTFALRESTGETANDTTANVYVDGFRVYQPMTTETAYVESEQGTKYYSLYDFVQTSINDLADATDNIALYVEYDGDTDTASIADYKIQGPQNELYLKSGNGIAFALAGYKEGDTVQVSAKAVTPGASLTEELSATEMYFDVPEDSIYYSDELGTYYAVVTNVETEDTNVMALCGLKVSDNITIFASGAMGEVVTEQVKEDNQEVFSPEKFNVKTAEKVRSGRNFTVSVETSTDATYVVVELADGTRHELTPTNTKAVASGIASVYKYSKAIKASNDFVVDGAIPVKVYAYTAKDGVASNPITVSVTVQ